MNIGEVCMYDAFVKKIIVYTKMDILDILHKETNIFIYAGIIDALELLGCIININIRAKCGYVYDAKNNSISSNHIKSLTDTYYTLINNFIKIAEINIEDINVEYVHSDLSSITITIGDKYDNNI
jgi:hypothetical protein